MKNINSQYKKLNELGSVGRGKSKHRPRNAPILYGGNYPFIQTGDVKKANFYITEYLQTYNDTGLAQSKLWKKGTLCITIAANIAETGILGIDACFPDSIIGFIPDPKKSDVRFVKYYLETYKLQMQSISQGATQDNLSLEKLLSINFLVPSLPEQQQIAEILGTYDDLIETNNQRIATLEQLAQQIYKEWFVRMRFPGWETTPLHHGIHEGWQIKNLGEIVSFEYGKSLVQENRIDGTIPVYGSSGIVGFHNKPLVNSPGIVVGRKGNVGAVHFVDRDFFPIDTVFYVAPNVQNWCFLFYMLSNQNFINSDAAVPGLNRNQAYSTKLLLPPQSLINQFEDLIRPIFDQMKVLRDQVDFLTKTRNLLLPRLISGKLTLKQANSIL